MLFSVLFFCLLCVFFFPIRSLCIFCSVGSSLSCFLELLVSYWHLSCLLLLCGWAGSLSEASVILHLIFALGCLKCIDHVFCFLWFFSAFFQNLIFIVVSYCSAFSQRIWTGPTSGFKQMGLARYVICQGQCECISLTLSILNWAFFTFTSEH